MAAGPRVCAAPLFRNPGNQRCQTESYRFTAAIIDGVVSAANAVINHPDNANKACVTRDTDPVTANQLASYVLAIPIREPTPTARSTRRSRPTT